MYKKHFYFLSKFQNTVIRLPLLSRKSNADFKNHGKIFPKKFTRKTFKTDLAVLLLNLDIF
jgi:hypothetical protein